MRELPPLKRREGKDPAFVRLELNDMHDLFAMPRHNAFHENYLPLSGVDQIALRLRMTRLHNGLHVTFVLPESADQDPNLEIEIKAALQRYCDNRLYNMLIDMKSRQLEVIRSLEIGVVILGISLALAATISHSETIVDWLRTLLSNSISIFGSVALWSPADAFLFGMRPMYRDLRIYHAIRDMTFDIKYEKAGAITADIKSRIFR